MTEHSGKIGKIADTEEIHRVGSSPDTENTEASLRVSAREETVNAVVRQLAATAIERDKAGGNAKRERDLIRQSGLLSLTIPEALGGDGENWQVTFDIVRRFAQVDSSIAHLFAFHHLLLATARLFGKPSQWRPWLQQTAANRWFWGNALNPLDKGTVATEVTDTVDSVNAADTTGSANQGAVSFDGRKRFCSGATDSDMLLASAFNAEDRLLIGVVPTSRSGISIMDDWDNMGQRQTDSGTVVFDKLIVEQDELLLEPGPLSSPFASLRPLLAQLILANIYLGIGQGAFAEARTFALNSARPWITSDASSTREDPYVLAHAGEFWLALEGARVLTDRAAAVLDSAWSRGLALTDEERGEVAIAVAAAKVSSGRAGLDVTSRMFEITGARSTTASLRFDRFWRNIRVHTLHDPVDYKVKELGEWALDERYPKPSFYS